jgi:hypothetical protein
MLAARPEGKYRGWWNETEAGAKSRLFVEVQED